MIKFKKTERELELRSVFNSFYNFNIKNYLTHTLTLWASLSVITSSI